MKISLQKLYCESKILLVWMKLFYLPIVEHEHVKHMSHTELDTIHNK